MRVSRSVEEFMAALTIFGGMAIARLSRADKPARRLSAKPMGHGRRDRCGASFNVRELPGASVSCRRKRNDAGRLFKTACWPLLGALSKLSVRASIRGVRALAELKLYSFTNGNVVCPSFPRDPPRRHDRLLAWNCLDRYSLRSHPGKSDRKADAAQLRLSDSAEAFVFLSGVSVALAHYGRAQTGGLARAVRAVFWRAYRIYGVHLGLTCAAVAIAAIGYFVSGATGLIEADGRSFVFHQPLQAGLGVLMLTQQLGYFNILRCMSCSCSGRPLCWLWCG